mmetsp:Transcript_29609/g.92482  ORF Transcript_29609/g.92482 Transcript_29609/m.92482 type:complete len:211 (-) Transcript_29609:265-897(-)
MTFGRGWQCCATQETLSGRPPRQQALSPGTPRRGTGAPGPRAPPRRPTSTTPTPRGTSPGSRCARCPSGRSSAGRAAPSAAVRPPRRLPPHPPGAGVPTRGPPAPPRLGRGAGGALRAAALRTGAPRPRPRQRRGPPRRGVGGVPPQGGRRRCHHWGLRAGAARGQRAPRGRPWQPWLLRVAVDPVPAGAMRPRRQPGPPVPGRPSWVPA